jgi:hypothetical protein
MGVTAGILLASILLKEMRSLVYIRYLWHEVEVYVYVLFKTEYEKNVLFVQVHV